MHIGKNTFYERQFKLMSLHRLQIHDTSIIRAIYYCKRSIADSETDDGGKISNDSEDDEMTISPPRRQAYHLFGTNPVWDEAAQMDLIELHSDSETSTCFPYVL